LRSGQDDALVALNPGIAWTPQPVLRDRAIVHADGLIGARVEEA
jgi:hypothetical protein